MPVDFHNPLPGVPHIESPFFDVLFRESEHSPEFLRIARDLLSKLYGRKAWPFQTLNFPMGTQQHYHTDAVHFSSVPERFMCGGPW